MVKILSQETFEKVCSMTDVIFPDQMLVNSYVCLYLMDLQSVYIFDKYSVCKIFSLL